MLVKQLHRAADDEGTVGVCGDGRLLRVTHTGPVPTAPGGEPERTTVLDVVQQQDGRLGRAVAELADTLVADFDVVEIATRVAQHCLDVVDADSAGVLLLDVHGRLRLLAATSEETETVETFQVRQGDGPCIAAVQDEATVMAEDPQELLRRWPGFARVATAQGIESVLAVPLRLRGRVIGSLNVFRHRVGQFEPDAVRRAIVLADMASLAIAQAETVRSHSETVRQLQTALDSRVVIEQAKGVVDASTGVGVDAAFALLRGHARATGRRLVDVARDVVERRITAGELGDPSGRQTPVGGV